MKPLYFDTDCPEGMAREKDYWIDELLDSDEDEKTIFKAKIERNISMFFCRKYFEATEKGNCGKDFCKHYIPRNGKSGICRENFPCYSADEPLILKREDYEKNNFKCHN